MSYVGGHVSVAGGLEKGIEKAEKIGASAIQIFGSSPRQWATRLPKEEDVSLYKKALKKSHVEFVFLHAPYLVNLGTPNDDHFLKSVHSLAAHLQIAETIGANGLIFHVGSIYGNRSYALERAVTGMKMVLEHCPGKTHLIMENSAGGEPKLGSSFEDLAFLLKKVKSPRVKICLDTAHAFESGLIEEYSPKLIKKFFDEFDKIVGIKHLEVLHVNDSKSAFNSRHDRHENIGKGHIGLEGFQNLAREKRVNNLPWILEVPGFDDHGPDKKNIKILSDCFN